jgi:hypothetical protein
MADQATLQARLTEAETALHELTIGRRSKAFTHAAGDVSRRLEWTEASIPQLRAYITDLRRQLGQTTGRRRAIGVTFR